MYLALAEERGVDPRSLAGTTQNDIVKEYLSRGTFIFGPEPSLPPDRRPDHPHGPSRARSGTRSTSARTTCRRPARHRCRSSRTRWPPRSTSSTRSAASGQVTADEFPDVVGRISFFVNAGIRFVEEMCKMRAFTQLWDRITAERYGVADDKLRRFRYGVQVNSLGLTEAQPENNVQRIVLETLGVTLSKRARGPRRPAPGLERGARAAPPVGPAVVAAHPAGAGVRDRPPRVRRPVRGLARSSRRRPRELAEAADAELEWVLDGGGAFAMIDAMKQRLVQSPTPSGCGASSRATSPWSA